MHWSNRIRRRILIAAVITVATLAASLGAQAAAEEEAAQAAQLVTELQPGLNPIGWIEAEAAVDRLFDEIPRLEAVYAWDAVEQDYVAAGRDIPQSLWTLRTLQPGMGLLLSISGTAPIDWPRSPLPAVGQVRLHPGLNFVAWLGGDSGPYAAERALGSALDSIIASGIPTEPPTQRPRPESSSESVSRSDPVSWSRGDALWLSVSQLVDWHQPTGILPPVTLLGDEALRAGHLIRNALRNTIRHMNWAFNTEMDFSAFELRITVGQRIATIDTISTDDDVWTPPGDGLTVSMDMHRCEHNFNYRFESYSGWDLLIHQAYAYSLVTMLRQSPGYTLPGWLLPGLVHGLVDDHLRVVGWDRDCRYFLEDGHAVGRGPGWYAIDWINERGGKHAWLDLMRIYTNSATATDEFSERFRASFGEFNAAFAPQLDDQPSLAPGDPMPRTVYQIKLDLPPRFKNTSNYISIRSLRPGRDLSMQMRRCKHELKHDPYRQSYDCLVFHAPPHKKFHLRIWLDNCSFYVGRDDAVALTSNDARVFGGTDERLVRITIPISEDVCLRTIQIGTQDDFRWDETYSVTPIAHALWIVASDTNDGWRFNSDAPASVQVPLPGDYAVRLIRMSTETEAWIHCSSWYGSESTAIYQPGNRIPPDVEVIRVDQADVTLPPNRDRRHRSNCRLFYTQPLWPL